MDEKTWFQLGVAVGVGLVLLVALWPVAGNGARLLKKWGLPEPTEQQVVEAVRYLKRRRLLYPWLYGGLLLVPRWSDDVDQFMVVVLAGTLLAELLALRPRLGARREAVLTPRGLFDVGSRWVLLSYAAFVTAAVVRLVVDPRWTTFAWLVGSVLAVGVIVWAAVTRPADGDHAVDMVLRTRSVHVAAGLGAAVAGGLAHPLVGVFGLVAWAMMANTRPKSAKIVR